MSPDLLARLDEFSRARNVPDRSQAVRIAVREATMTPEQRQMTPDRDEVLRLLGQAARDGSVLACKLLLEEYRREPAAAKSKLSIIDELAARREPVIA